MTHKPHDLRVEIIDSGEHQENPRSDGTIAADSGPVRLVVGRYFGHGLDWVPARQAFDIAIAELRREGSTGHGKTMPLDDYYAGWYGPHDDNPVFFFGYQDETVAELSYWIAFRVSRQLGDLTVQWITSDQSPDEPYVRLQGWNTGLLGTSKFQYGFCPTGDTPQPTPEDLWGMHLYILRQAESGATPHSARVHTEPAKQHTTSPGRSCN